MKTGLQSASIFHSNLSLSNAPHSGLNGHYRSKDARNFIHNYSDIENKRTRFWKKCECGRLYRKKIIQTAMIGWAFFFLGWSVGIFGPCFPDLMLLLNKDLETASWLFSIGAFGYLVGSMLGGVVYDRYNKLLLLFISVVGMSVTNGAIPWCSSLPLMLAMTFLCSMFEGSIETGGNADIVSLWGAECSPFMLAIHFAYSAGGIISPFVTQPFLAERLIRSTSNQNKTYSYWNATNSPVASVPFGNNSVEFGRIADLHGTVNDNTNSATHQLFRQLRTSNDSSAAGVLLQYAESINISEDGRTNDNEVVNYFENYGKTNIQYSFLIAATLSLSAAIPFLVLYLSSGTKQQKRDNSDRLNSNEVEVAIRKRHSSLPFRPKIVCLVLLSVIMFLYNAVEDNFTGLLMTFSISYLGWSKAYGTIATSLDWASFALGRLLGIFFVRCVQTSSILTGHFVLLIISFVGFLLASIMSQTFLIWAFVPLVGFAKSIILPSVFSWTEEKILPVTGKISSLYLVTGSAGSMVSPLLFGYLMEENDPIWYVYLLLGMTLGCFSAFLSVRITKRLWIKPLISKDRHDKIETVHLNGHS